MADWVDLQTATSSNARIGIYFMRKKNCLCQKEISTYVIFKWILSFFAVSSKYHFPFSHFKISNQNKFQVVICKLRSEGTTTERSRQHWRAAKALLVIFPLLGMSPFLIFGALLLHCIHYLIGIYISSLLGISYIITLTGPTEGTPGHQVFQYVRAFLLSIQVCTLVIIPICHIL